MRICAPAAILFSVVAALSFHAGVRAQTTVIGGSGQTGVIVNLNAIPGHTGGGLALGANSGIGRLLIPNLDPPPGGSRLVLRAPRAKAAAAAPMKRAGAATPKPVKTAVAAPTPPAVEPPAAVIQPVPPVTPKVASAPPPAPRKQLSARAVAPPPPPKTEPPAPVAKAAAPPPPKPKTAAAAKPAQKMAALPGADETMMQLRFRSGSSAISTDDEARLAALSKRLADTSVRLQLKAFADAANGDASSTRRLSLSRALAVRAYLIENGMRSTRIDVRALGTARDGGPSDRVDVIILER